MNLGRLHLNPYQRKETMNKGLTLKEYFALLSDKEKIAVYNKVTTNIKSTSTYDTAKFCYRILEFDFISIQLSDTIVQHANPEVIMFMSIDRDGVVTYVHNKEENRTRNIKVYRSKTSDVRNRLYKFTSI